MTKILFFILTILCVLTAIYLAVHDNLLSVIFLMFTVVFGVIFYSLDDE